MFDFYKRHLEKCRICIGPSKSLYWQESRKQISCVISPAPLGIYLLLSSVRDNDIVIQGFVKGISFIYSHYLRRFWYKEVTHVNSFGHISSETFLSEMLYYIYVAAWSTV